MPLNPSKTPLIGRDKKAIEEREPMELLACNIPIPPGRKKNATARQKLPIPQAVLSLNPSRA